MFSTGMAKRLNIARLMITGPEILYLDEPYSGLDLERVPRRIQVGVGGEPVLACRDPLVVEPLEPVAVGVRFRS